MKKIILSTALLCSTALWAEFNFGECSGSGTFSQHIDAYAGDQEKAVLVGFIPQGIQGLKIELKSDKDVDIRLYGDKNDNLYGELNDKIVHWPSGLLNKGLKETRMYKGVAITYSGFNGTNGQRGHEYIYLNGATPTAMEMKAFGYQEGDATVDYSWTGKEGCSVADNGSGHFTQAIPKQNIAVVGDIPTGIDNLEISLQSNKDIDIQLYGEDGTAIIAWPSGILNGPSKQTTDYKGMTIEWSGYAGTNGKKGHEYIKVSGKTTKKITMKVLGYQAGTADVDYRWGEKNDTTHNPACITKIELKAKIDANEDVTKVNTSCITDMSELFQYKTNFNQDISNWDVSNVTNMKNMFSYADKFNQPIGKWDVSSVTNMSGMFEYIRNFNQDISNWNVSNVTNMSGMFAWSHAFNQPLDKWDVSNVTNMYIMFNVASSFNQPLNNWDVSNVTNMSGMFSIARKFNQPLDKWDVSNVTNMSWMFGDVDDLTQSTFNQSLATWDVSNVKDMSIMIAGSNLSSTNLNSTLEAWSKQNLQHNVPIDIKTKNFDLSQVSSSILAKLKNTFNWDITYVGFSYSDD